jgi:hypothetical protein
MQEEPRRLPFSDESSSSSNSVDSEQGREAERQ